MAVKLTKSMASAGNVGAPNWGRLLAIIEFLLKAFGPIAVPMIEAWIATLPLTPAQIAFIDSLIEKILNPAPVP